MKKLSNTEDEFKNSVAYKKSLYIKLQSKPHLKFCMFRMVREINAFN